MARSGEVRLGSERVRVGPWRGSDQVGLITPMGGAAAASEAIVQKACRTLVAGGYIEMLTGALAADERRGFIDAGFELRDELVLLAHDLAAIPEAPPASIRRGRRGDRARALAVDGRAFPPFWRLDTEGFDEAVAATPVARFRVATVGREVVGYAVTGRAGHHGYLQRLAVDPDRTGRGLGRALVADALNWLRHRQCTLAVVNTQVGNDRAVTLYEGMGFRRQPSGLVVLGRQLDARQPAG
ncbi:MAG: GNAT family N-acetyltransferase [Acidobacteria bacterium]|nr:GNAT family N-acetyltransferase [Acidobacteriota bacterium]